MLSWRCDKVPLLIITDVMIIHCNNFVLDRSVYEPR
uniref:Uncharacterized protein n=1 Tax=Klebsiella phage vB_KpnM_Iguana_ER37 TaxID=3076781 RepID=A0AB38Z4C0_9CAUD